MILHKTHPEIKNGKKGMILAFTLAILILMSLMGIVILSNTKTELSVSGNHRVNREAFNAADTAARISILMGRILLHPELGVDPAAIIRSSSAPENPIVIELNNSDTSPLSLSALQTAANDPDTTFLNRYIDTIGTNPDPSAPKPHIIFKVDDRVVATAVVTLESDNPVSAGMSLGSGGAVQVTLVTTIRGAPFADIAGPDFMEPQSIITTMYRDYIEGAL
jgi:hypothetical protein